MTLTHPADGAAIRERHVPGLAGTRAVAGEDGTTALHLLVEGVHCANCIAKIERTLNALDEVIDARVNFSTRRLFVRWNGGPNLADRMVAAVEGAGFGATPFDPAILESRSEDEDKALLRALGVAGFAAANIMLLSVSVWAGLWTDMDTATRDMMHWVSALIAIPAVAYAGQPFFRSAAAALRARRTNMDVPISLALVLALAVSLIETAQSGLHAYFDASVSLLFFLLIGRYLDRRARAEARRSAERLLLLRATSATVVDPDGRSRSLPVEALCPGMLVRVAPGERFPADGRIETGQTEIDTSLVTGESVPSAAAAGSDIFAGTLNVAAAVTVRITKTGEDTLLAGIARLVEAAEQGRARFVRLADRIARWYAPAVHILALATFAGWTLLAGAAWQTGLLHAVAVLIITCPCALGLAVPVVQVVATGRLLADGVLLKQADALERLAKVDTVVFDKTGTLTRGVLSLASSETRIPEAADVAAAMAAASLHPLSRALVRACPAGPAVEAREVPGCGVTAQIDGREWRLGRRDWVGSGAESFARRAEETGPELWLAREGEMVAHFVFRDVLRPGAAETVAALKARGFDVLLLSGDRPGVVRMTAGEAGIDDWQAACLPAGKVDRLASLAAEGRHVLMVGDGLNDAPALAAAHVSMSPASAADISQVHADLVFQGEGLDAVTRALDVAARSHRLTIQNIVLAIAYNAAAVPLAMAGFVTPLIAAVAMSSSSLLVTLNSLRLRVRRRHGAGV